MSGVRKPVMKNNVLPFPALMRAPKDPPRSGPWKGIAVFIAIGLLAYTALVLCLP